MNKNTSNTQNQEEKKNTPAIFQDMSKPANAKKFLSDLLFDAEDCNHLEGTVDGLMLLFEAIHQNDSPNAFLEDLQVYLYSWTPAHSEAFTAYFESVKAGKDYRAKASPDSE